ncbi:MAG TPA: sarcosine oxidase subunit gamma family protein [Burkholderiaceae bacterium]|nr:sarcosine oxidase subunit gamma family protein [Burkholderiaceae bacterium]
MHEPSPTPTLRSALADCLPAPASPAAQAQAGVRVAEWPHVACIVLRGRADDSLFVRGVQAACGVTLPTQSGTFSATANTVALWIAPDEWWLLAPRVARDGLVIALRQATAGLHAQVADNSGGLACLHLAGPQHVTLLRHLSPYDFESLGIGRCVSTVIPKAGVTVLRGDDDGVLLLCRRSFADWIWRLVKRSARPYGLVVCAPHDLPAPAFATLRVGT